jgi:hypothetical protein
MASPRKRHRAAQEAPGPPAPASLLKFPDDVLDLVLRAAFGTDTFGRLPFLATSRLTHKNPTLWGTEISLVVVDGKRPQPGWLRERESIRSVTLACSKYNYTSLHQWDLDLLQGSTIQKLVIDRAVVDIFGGGHFWRSLSQLPLTHLSVPDYRTSLKGIREALPRLRHLDWRGLEKNAELRHIQGLPLTHLGLRHAYPRPTTLDGLITKSSFGSLTSLDLADCHYLRSLDALRGMPLTSLNLGRCSRLRSLDALRRMPLTSLDISRCIRLGMDDIAVLATLPLVKLEYRGCRYVGHLIFVASLGATLQHLDLSHSKITDASLALLSELKLRTLSLRKCKNLTAAGIAHLKSMSASFEVLDLRGIEDDDSDEDDSDDDSEEDSEDDSEEDSERDPDEDSEDDSEDYSDRFDSEGILMMPF